MLLKTPIVCLLFMIYMIGFYYRKPHIPVKSTKIFQILTKVALLNVLFDFITVYTVNHRDIILDEVNLIAHIIYLLSILGFIYVLFLYMRSYLEADLKFNRIVRGLHSLPFLLSAIGILVLPITYVHGKTTDYSLGPKAYALYGSIVIYLIFILYYCLRYWKLLDEDKRTAIILAVPIYVVISSIQMLMPEVLLEVVGSSLIMLGLILSNENMEKYVDNKTALFNQYSLELVLEEHDFEKQKIVLAVLCFCKMENNFDWRQDILILQDICKEIKLYRLQGYHICENGVAFISSSKEKAHIVLEKVKNDVERKYGTDSVSIGIKVLSKEETVTKHSCMQNSIAFCTETGSHFAYVDYMTHVYNRNALERDLRKLSRDNDSYYIIADLNDLKAVNDAIGHSAGDRVLQAFAGMLVNTAGERGRVYRQGGDEFAVLYEEEAEPYIRELAERCRVYNQSSNIPVSYAIGYCRCSQENFLDTADRMMYANKREIKRQKASLKKQE